MIGPWGKDHQHIPPIGHLIGEGRECSEERFGGQQTLRERDEPMLDRDTRPRAKRAPPGKPGEGLGTLDNQPGERRGTTEQSPGRDGSRRAAIEEAGE